MASFDQGELGPTAGVLDALEFLLFTPSRKMGGVSALPAVVPSVPRSAHARTLTFTTWLLLFASCPYKEGEKVSVLR